MHIERYDGKFRVSFLENDLKRQVRPMWHTDSSDKLLEMFERGAESRRLEDRQAWEMAIRGGRGACWLKLNETQYRTLKGVT